MIRPRWWNHSHYSVDQMEYHLLLWAFSKMEGYSFVGQYMERSNQSNVTYVTSSIH